METEENTDENTEKNTEENTDVNSKFDDKPWDEIGEFEETTNDDITTEDGNPEVEQEMPFEIIKSEESVNDGMKDNAENINALPGASVVPFNTFNTFESDTSIIEGTEIIWMMTLEIFERVKKYFSSLRQNSNESEIGHEIPYFQEHEKQECYNIKTLGDALRHFDLYFYLNALDRSLEDVRQDTKKKEIHEEKFKQFDKKLKSLGLKYHHDKVRNKTDAENELEIAENFQKILNSTRDVLKYLNAAFLKDMRTVHKFEFYTNLNISTLSNEKEIENRIFEMKLKICIMSKIKRQNIILNIRHFIIQSKRCINSYLQNNIYEFHESRCYALFYLNCTIEGFKKFCDELDVMGKQRKIKKYNHILSVFRNMERESKRDLNLLQFLEKTAKSSLKGNYQFFSSEEFMDPYLVCPFVYYTNIILICSFRLKYDLPWERFRISLLYNWKFNNKLFELQLLYDLALCYKVYKYPETYSFRQHGKMSTEEIEIEFLRNLENIHKNMELKFNVDHYSEIMLIDILSLELEKCMTMMNEFQEKAKELSDSIQEFRKNSQEVEEKFKESDEVARKSEELNKDSDAIFEENKKIKEKFERLSSMLSHLE